MKPWIMWSAPSLLLFSAALQSGIRVLIKGTLLVLFFFLIPPPFYLFFYFIYLFIYFFFFFYLFYYVHMGSSMMYVKVFE